MIAIDSLRFDQGVLAVHCTGAIGIGSEGRPDGVALQSAISDWMTRHSDRCVHEIELDFTRVDYRWGDTPMTSMLPLIRRGVETFRFLASASNGAALQSLVDSTGTPWFSVDVVDH